MKLSPSQKRTINGLLRKILVARDGERCLKCGSTERLQMSHIYPKGKHRRMEFESDNLKFLCYPCHFFFWHKSPIEAWDWIRLKMPQDRLQRLKLMSLASGPTGHQFATYKLFLEAELDRLEEKTKVNGIKAVRTYK